MLQRGPPGPQGPPGAEVTKDDMVKEFKKMVKQAAEKRARKIIKAKVGGRKSVIQFSKTPTSSASLVSTLRLISHLQLSSD